MNNQKVYAALNKEPDFVINLVNDTLDKVYLSYDKNDMFDNITNVLAGKLIQQVIKLFPYLSAELNAKSYRKDKRAQLQEAVKDLSPSQIIELIDSLHSRGMEKLLNNALYFLTLGLLDKAVRSTLAWALDCDLNNLTKEQNIQLTRALGYITLLFNNG